MAGSRVYVESPVPQPLPFGLLSVADDRGGGNGHWQQGVEYDSDNCTVTLATASGYCVTPSGTNEVQTVTISGAPTGGTFTLSTMGETTAPIARNASAATVQSELEKLSAFNTGDVTVTGAAPTYTITYGGAYTATNVPQITATHAFTGGSSPSIATATTTPGVRTAKTLTASPGYIDEDPFTVYLLRQCAPVGDSDAKNRAVKMFTGSETVGVEKGFWAQITAASSGAVDITGGTARNTLAEGLAALEQYAATHYGGRPTIHVDRATGSLLGTKQAVERHGNRLETVLGAPVAAGGGYGPNGVAGAAPGAGEVWMFVTGVVSLWRGAANVHGPILQQDATNAYVNQWVTMVERTYLTSPDCMIAAVKAKVA